MTLKFVEKCWVYFLYLSILPIVQGPVSVTWHDAVARFCWCDVTLSQALQHHIMLLRQDPDVCVWHLFALGAWVGLWFGGQPFYSVCGLEYICISSNYVWKTDGPHYVRTDVDGLVQACGNSSALAMGLLESCTKLSIYIIVEKNEIHKWISK